MGFHANRTIVPSTLAALLAHSVAFAQLPAARMSWLFPAGATPGSTNTITVAGSDLDDPKSLLFSDRRIIGTPVPGNPAQFTVVVPAGVAPGAVDARFAGRFGASPPLSFLVGNLPGIVASTTNTAAGYAMAIDQAHAYHARVAPGATHWFRFDARKGERIVARAEAARIDSRLVPGLAVFDANGVELARARRLGWVDFAAPADGSFLLQLTDDLFRGGDDYPCIVTLDASPAVDFALPFVLKAGTTNRVALLGRNLPGGRATSFHGVDGAALQTVEAEVVTPVDPDPAAWPADQTRRPAQAGAAIWEWKWPTTNGLSNPVLLVLTPRDVVAAPLPAPGAKDDRLSGGLLEIAPPVDFGGVFPHAGEVSGVVFKARKGDVFQIELTSERLGLPVDPHAIVQRAKGTDSWTDVTEIGDLDGNFGGNEFNTTSRDGIGKLEVGEDGTYRILVRDRFHGSPSSPRRPYALSIRKPTPDFALAAWPAPPPKANNDDRNLHPAGWVLRRGQTVGVRVAVLRRDGFDGAVSLVCAELPTGVTAAETAVGPGQNSGWLLLTAGDDAPESTADVRILGTATTAGAKPREARWGAVKWQVADFNNEAAANRLARRTTLGIIAEAMPLVVVPSATNAIVATVDGKVSIPFAAVRRFDSQAAFALKVSGHASLEKVPEVKFAEKATNAVLELNLAESKLPEGTHTLWLQGQSVVKYRNQPEAVDVADAALKEAEKTLATATPARKAGAESAKKSAEATRKAAEERAKPRDVTVSIWSRPFVVRVEAPPKK